MGWAGLGSDVGIGGRFKDSDLFSLGLCNDTHAFASHIVFACTVFAQGTSPAFVRALHYYGFERSLIIWSFVTVITFGIGMKRLVGWILRWIIAGGMLSL